MPIYDAFDAKASVNVNHLLTLHVSTSNVESEEPMVFLSVIHPTIVGTLCAFVHDFVHCFSSVSDNAVHLGSQLIFFADYHRRHYTEHR